MTPEQVKLVQDSFAKVVPIADRAAAYGTLSGFMINEAYGAAAEAAE